MGNLATTVANTQFPVWLEVLKIVIIIVSAFLFGFIIWALANTSWLKRFLLQDFYEITSYKPYGATVNVKQWIKIIRRLESGMESESKLAVIEADGMLDDTLNRMGYAGESLGERLKQLSAATLPSIKDVLDAHKIRNSIVHDPDYRLTFDQARKVLEYYEKALRELQILT